jgi:hypothetical protein
MSWARAFIEYVHAACTGLWLQTVVPEEAERELVRLAHEQSWKLALWDIAQGLRLPGQPTSPSAAGDPLAALRALPGLASAEDTTLLVLHQFHRFLTHAEVVQSVFNHVVAGRQRRTFVVVLSPVVQLPIELEKLFVVLTHDLPDRPALEAIARELASAEAEGLPGPEGLTQVLDAAAGLTRSEAEMAFALSLARHGRLQAEAVTELKAQTLRKNPLLTLATGTASFADLGGLQALKDFCRRALAPRPDRPVEARPRGVLLLSPPGCGKSMFARALGHELGRPTLVLDLGALYGGLVGQTEQNVRQALRTIDALAPCVVFLDEVEKGLAGIRGQGDSGVASRLFGSLLTWLNDRTSDSFVVCTSNDIAALPPEFSRAERFDATVFLDLPSSAEKDQIWAIHRARFGIPAEQARPDDTDWSGAEVRACCRLAALLGVPLTQAARQVVPVAVTAAERIAELRAWASGRCLSASVPGLYVHEPAAATPSARRIQRGQRN